MNIYSVNTHFSVILQLRLSVLCYENGNFSSSWKHVLIPDFFSLLLLSLYFLTLNAIWHFLHPALHYFCFFFPIASLYFFFICGVGGEKSHIEINAGILLNFFIFSHVNMSCPSTIFPLDVWNSFWFFFFHFLYRLFVIFLTPFFSWHLYIRPHASWCLLSAAKANMSFTPDRNVNWGQCGH